MISGFYFIARLFIPRFPLSLSLLSLVTMFLAFVYFSSRYYRSSLHSSLSSPLLFIARHYVPRFILFTFTVRRSFIAPLYVYLYYYYSRLLYCH